MLLKILIWPILALSPSCAATANYSVQLLKSVAPAGMSYTQWAAVADTMIGKTQAHILTDLIEDLAIELKITDAEVRSQIDSDRISIGLDPLPPHAEKKGEFHFLKKNFQAVEDPNDVSVYLPPGWTEEKLQDHNSEDIAALPVQVQERLTFRLAHDLEEEKTNPNLGFLDQIPDKVNRNIATSLHEFARTSHGLAPGVRVYKRNIAPLAAVVEIQNYENYGFVLYRTSYRNEKDWEIFMETLNEILSDSMAGDWHGDGLEAIWDQYLMPVDDDSVLDGGSAEDCRERFRKLREEGVIPYGLDNGVLLMADEKSVRSMVDEIQQGVEDDNPPHVWAVDVDFDPKQNSYPDGYVGLFEVRTRAILHDLYVALGSGLMSPVDVWKLLQRKSVPEILGGKEHDEL